MHLAAPTLSGQGAGTLSAVPSAAPLLDLDDGASAAPPLLQLLEEMRAFVQSELAAGRIPTNEEIEAFLYDLVENLKPLVGEAPVADRETLKAGLASLGWDAIDNTPAAPDSSPPTPEAVLAFLVESLAKLGPASAGRNPCLAPAPSSNDSQLEGARPAGGAALGPLNSAGAAPMAPQPVDVPAFKRPQLERGTLGTPERLATNFTTLKTS